MAESRWLMLLRSVCMARVASVLARMTSEWVRTADSKTVTFSSTLSSLGLIPVTSSRMMDNDSPNMRNCESISSLSTLARRASSWEGRDGSLDGFLGDFTGMIVRPGGVFCQTLDGISGKMAAHLDEV